MYLARRKGAWHLVHVHVLSIRQRAHAAGSVLACSSCLAHTSDPRARQAAEQTPGPVMHAGCP